MNERIVIQTDGAPLPVGPYSQAIKYHDTVFLAGQLGIDPATGKLQGPDTGHQLVRIMMNIEKILDFIGLTLHHIVRCTVFVADLNDMEVVNKVFGKYFAFEPPARTTVQVAALPMGARIEIEATAMFTPASRTPAKALK